MGKKFVITEGRTDLSILTKLLPASVLEKVEMVAASGSSAALAWATTLLSTTDKDVVLVADSDSTRDAEIQEKKDFLSMMLRHSGERDRFEVMIFSPEIETIYFQNKEVASLLAKRDISDIELQLAADSPKKGLKLLFNIDPKHRSEVLERLTPNAIAKLQNTPTMRELIGYLEQNGTARKNARKAA